MKVTEGPPRTLGSVLWIDEKAWESGSQVRAVHQPISIDTWIAVTRSKGYKVVWTPDGALDEGPYRGGSVVEVDSEMPGDAGRAYFAIPTEVLDDLQEIMRSEDYRMVREDVDNIDNHEAHGYTVTRLDPASWERRGEVVPLAEPITTEAWVLQIRQQHLRVAPPVSHPLPLDSFYPAGQVVPVDESMGRSYFAVPRAAYWLAYDLADETTAAELSATPVAAAPR
ncbi:MAG: hypothetical protein ACR2JY_23825 [Chloroflexota bacterium]